ncbi:peptidyl-prolyl cis-trans isomerase A (cyclophilin A) [Novosphingobium sp. PhB165]|uniref:peptidylprolyl isomerase n=1 Tax=Novosphingobium sp. PhB165 TaxID=2485105 RepID=UPI0010E15E94|nr:peptidylprolyl isomerase [Novosphingobium sp. PhB165]TCM17936.1 peptidyl-prolyl cis-trans isomerase A (cyclophilin A) [Novosphingobium sp. PhB165]
MARWNRRLAVPVLAGAALALMAAPAMAQQAPAAAATAPAPAATPVEYAYVAMVTSEGTIVLALDKTHAPLTTANFLKYVDGKKFDGTTFYRSMHLDWGDTPAGLVQGGLQGIKVLPPVAHEPTSQTGLHHTSGTISMARYAPGTATADFTIMVGDVVTLDANPSSDNPEFKAGFAAFGHVVSGMDVVHKIWDAPRSATKGEGVMRGQMLDPPVKIVSARRVPAPPTPAQ